MDLAKVPVRTIATLIANGTRQIGEVPTARRSMVQNEVDKILAAKAESNKVEDWGTEGNFMETIEFELPANLTKCTVDQLRAFASQYPSIKLESKMRKPDLIAAIEEAQNAGNNPES
jgi:hypothetical protein